MLKNTLAIRRRFIGNCIDVSVVNRLYCLELFDSVELFNVNVLNEKEVSLISIQSLNLRIHSKNVFQADNTEKNNTWKRSVNLNY